MAAAGAADSHVDDNVDPGMHQTDSVDIIYIVSGECVVILEEAETVLRAGDTFIQRGTKHAGGSPAPAMRPLDPHGGRTPLSDGFIGAEMSRR